MWFSTLEIRTIFSYFFYQAIVLWKAEICKNLHTGRLITKVQLGLVVRALA